MPSNLNNPVIDLMKKIEEERKLKALKHEELRSSGPYQSELSLLQNTVHHLIQTLKLYQIASSRWSHFTENYLFPGHFDELVEAAITAKLAIENGALNPARRELRYMLELSVNIAYVDEMKSDDTFEERIKFFKSKRVKKRNVDHIFQLPLRMLQKHKDDFAKSVLNAWVKASNYVHLTKKEWTKS